MRFKEKWIILLCCALLFSGFPVSTPASADAGSWADHADTSWYDANFTTFMIDSAAKLAGAAKLVNEGTTDFSGKTLQIPANLSLAGYGWVPMGNAEHPFKGILIGQTGLNPALTDLTVTGSTYAGLIGSMSGATVGKFTLSGVVSGNVTAAGAIAGYMDQDSTILDVTSTVNIQVDQSVTGSVYAGGIVGSGSGLLYNVANHGSVALSGSQHGMAGGIAGAAHGLLTLKKGENTGLVSVSGGFSKADAGGIVGLVSGSLFMEEESTFIRNSGQVTATNTGGGGIGGIMGRVTAGSTATFSTVTSNSGAISVNPDAAAATGASGTSAGGLVGAYENTQGLHLTIPFEQSAPAIINHAGSRTYTGAVVGSVAGDFTWGQSFANSSPLTTSGSDEVYTGGIAGKVEGTAIFQAAVKNNAPIHAAASGNGLYTAGLVGFVGGNQLLLNSTAAGAYDNSGSITVSGTASEVYTGGIISNKSYVKAASNVTSTGSITVTGAERLFTGGFVGGIASGSAAGIANEAYNGKLAVTSMGTSADNRVYTGGIAGYYGLAGTIESPVFSGEISVTGGAGVHTGGVVGYLTGGGTIANAVIGHTADAPARIDSSGNAGGVAGYADGVVRSPVAKYTDIHTTGSNGTAGGIVGWAQGQILHAVVGDPSASANDSLKVSTDSTDSAAGAVLGKGDGALLLGPAAVERISLASGSGADRSSLGGLAGKLSDGVAASVQGAPFTVNHVAITSTAANAAVGGVIGDNGIKLDPTILQPVSGITIDAQGDHSDLGGIVGRSSAQLAGLTVSNLSIKGSGVATQLGGLAGFTSAAVSSPTVNPGDGELLLAATGPDAAVGGVAGKVSAGAVISGNGADSNVTGLVVTTAAQASGARIGGIAGDSSASSLEGVVVESPVLNAAGPDSILGGLVGRIIGGGIAQSVVRGALPDYSMLTVSGSGAQAGGLAGRAENAVLTGGASTIHVENLLLTGNESASGLYAGGIVGYSLDSAIGQMTGSTLKLTLKGTGTVAGGLAGYHRGVAGYGQPAASRIVKDNKLKALAILLPSSAASSTTGGLIGLNDARSDENPDMASASAASSIQSSQMNGSITVHAPSSATGGLVGENRSVIAKNSIIETIPLLSDGDRGLVGGLVGRNTGTLYYIFSNAVLSAGGEASVIGGLVGENTGKMLSTYIQSDLESSVSGTENSYALLGGLVGRNSGSVEKSYTLSHVTANGAYTYTGGLTGEHSSGSIVNSYAGKDVSAHGEGSYSGGLIGRMNAGTVAGSYSAGQITGDNGAYPGAFAGYYAGTRKDLIDNTYYVKDENLSINSGVLDFGGGTYYELNNYARLSPILSADLADRDVFPGLSGWTFSDSAWRYGFASADYSYPELNLSADDGESGIPASMSFNWYTRNPDALSFTLRTEDDLAGLSAIVNGTATGVNKFNFLGRTLDLAASINIKATRWVPIGADANHAFEGTFNGNHHLISDFKVSGGDYAGLFGVLGGDAAVKQISLAPFLVTGSKFTGALAGLNLGRVEQVGVSLSGNVKVANGTSVGGILGRNEGQASGLSLTLSGGGTVQSSAEGAIVGGLIGDNRSGLANGRAELRSGTIEATGSNAVVGGLTGKQHGDLTEASLLVEGGGGIMAAGEGSLVGGLSGTAESGVADGLSVSLSGGGIKAAAAHSVAGGMFGRSEAGQVIRHAKLTGDNTPAGGIAGTAGSGGIVGAKAGLGGNTFELDQVEVRDVVLAAAGEGGLLGGIAGSLTDSAVGEAQFAGVLAAEGNSTRVGGIAGWASNSILYKPQSSPQITVSVAAGDSAVGGIAGVLESSRGESPLDFGLLVPLYPGVYEAKLPTGSISIAGTGQAADLYAGGIAGRLSSVSVYNSTTALSLGVTGGKTATVGGAAGYAEGSRVVGVSAISRIRAEDSTNYSVGGLAGQMSGGGVAYTRAEAADASPIFIGESTASGRIATFAHIGGFVGLADGTDIQTSSTNQSIALDSANPYFTVYAGGFAGLLGDSASGVISQAYAQGQVTAKGQAGVYTGGFAGTVNRYHIQQAYASGDVLNTGFDARGGGFAGSINHGSLIEDAYAAQEQVNVTGGHGATRSYAGGFAGYNDGSLSRVYERVSEVSAVAGGSNSYMGAFIGYNFRNGLVEDAYYEGSLAPIKHDTSSSGQSSNVKLLSFTGYSEPDNWTFSGHDPVWTFGSGEDPYAPKLMGIANWRFSPDLGFMTRTAKGQTMFEAANAAELAGLAILNDDGASLYGLFDPHAAGAPAVDGVALTADIALAGKPWLPIASFNGVMEGNRHVVSGLNYHSKGYDNYGLISENHGLITNLTLSAADVTGGTRTGLIAGVNAPQGSILQVTVSGGSISGQGSINGGVVGDNQGQISGVVAENLLLTGMEAVGGAAGSNTGLMKDVAVTGVTIRAVNAAGGVAGNNEGGIEASFAGGSILASNPEGESAAGGIAGRNGAGGSITGSFSYSEVNVLAKDASAGGIAGSSSGRIANSYNTGTVESSGQDYARAGGIAGYAGAGSISATVNGGEIAADIHGALSKGRTLTGGIAGQLDAAALAGNYFDVQMLQLPVAYYTPAGSKVSTAAGKAEGLRTSQLTGGVLPAGLEASMWQGHPDFYPQLALHSGSPASDLSTAAVMLGSADTVYRVKESYKTTDAASIAWTAAGEAGPIRLLASKGGQSRLIIINKTPLAYGETAAAPASTTSLEFKEKTEVVLASSDAEGMIYYTVDGSEPSEASLLYTKPIALSSSATVKAMTVVDGKNNSELFTAAFKKLSDSTTGGGGGGFTGGGGMIQPSGATVDILVNGKAETTGEESTATKDNRVTSSITVNNDTMVKLVKEKGNQAEIALVFTQTADVHQARLSGELVRQMAEFDDLLLIRAGTSVYRIPAKQLYQERLWQEGTGQPAVTAELRIEIAAPDAAVAMRLQQAAAAQGYAVEASPVMFRAVYEAGGKEEALAWFDAYVERTIALPKTAAATGVAGVIIAEDGSVSPVPTRISDTGRVKTATFNSMASNGIFALVSAKVAFGDTASHWAQQAITDLAGRMIVSGVSEGRFEPERSITRAEFAAITVKALGLLGAPAGNGAPFHDVSSMDWYSPYIGAAYAFGLVAGNGDGSFGAQDTISREQAMVILARAMKLAGMQAAVTEAETEQLLALFTDAGSIDDYAKASVAASVKAGLVTGRSDAQIAPAEPMTRAEVAGILQRLLRLSHLIQ